MIPKRLRLPAPTALPVMDRFEQLDALIIAGCGDTPGYSITSAQFATALVDFCKLSPADRREALLAGWKRSNPRRGPAQRVAA